MKLDDKAILLSLLYQLNRALYDQAEKDNNEVNETLDEAIRTLIHYLD